MCHLCVGHCGIKNQRDLFGQCGSELLINSKSIFVIQNLKIVGFPTAIAVRNFCLRMVSWSWLYARIVYMISNLKSSLQHFWRRVSRSLRSVNFMVYWRTNSAYHHPSCRLQIIWQQGHFVLNLFENALCAKRAKCNNDLYLIFSVFKYFSL